jgi:hypothetical protein
MPQPEYMTVHFLGVCTWWYMYWYSVVTLLQGTCIHAQHDYVCY